MSRNYRTFMLSDEPKIVGIPITTGLPVFILTALGFLMGYVYQLFVIGAVLSVAMHYIYGGLPIRILLAMAYWSFPKSLTRLIFRAFPDSSVRQYIW